MCSANNHIEFATNQLPSNGYRLVGFRLYGYLCKLKKEKVIQFANGL